MALLLADDLTGCCDSGIKFNALPVLVSLAGDLPPALDPREMLAINADSRNLPAAQGSAVTREIVERLKDRLPGKPDLLFKKLDSTLRGNPGAEIAAIAEAWDYEAAFIAPASPAMGRTICQGLLAINGVPLAQTAFGRDPGSPMTRSDVPGILGLQGASLVSLEHLKSGSANLESLLRGLLASGARYLIFDSERQDQLDLIARIGLRMNPPPLFAGAAGLAEALAIQIQCGSNPESRAIQAGKILYICGSANKATHEQLEKLAQTGVPVNFLTPTFSISDVPGLATKIASQLKSGSTALAITRERLPDLKAAQAQIAGLAAITQSILENEISGDVALFLTGGETAFAVLKRLAKFMCLASEIVPGVVSGWLTDGSFKDLPVITKAGGFGGRKALVEVLRSVTGEKNG